MAATTSTMTLMTTTTSTTATAVTTTTGTTMTMVYGLKDTIARGCGDATLACRSTFIGVIQPRIERPTAERRNGNTQRLSSGRCAVADDDDDPPATARAPGTVLVGDTKRSRMVERGFSVGTGREEVRGYACRKGNAHSAARARTHGA